MIGNIIFIDLDDLFDAKYLHRYECARMARLLTLVTDEMIKRMVWNKFKAL